MNLHQTTSTIGFGFSDEDVEVMETAEAAKEEDKEETKTE